MIVIIIELKRRWDGILCNITVCIFLAEEKNCWFSGPIRLWNSLYYYITLLPYYTTTTGGNDENVDGAARVSSV